MRTKIGNNGRIVIPATYRKALGIADGDEIIMQLHDGELRLMSRAAAIRRFQDLVRSRIPEGRLLSEELSAERRAEASRE